MIKGAPWIAGNVALCFALIHDPVIFIELWDLDFELVFKIADQVVDVGVEETCVSHASHPRRVLSPAQSSKQKTARLPCAAAL